MLISTQYQFLSLVCPHFHVHDDGYVLIFNRLIVDVCSSVCAFPDIASITDKHSLASMVLFLMISWFIYTFSEFKTPAKPQSSHNQHFVFQCFAPTSPFKCLFYNTVQSVLSLYSDSYSYMSTSVRRCSVRLIMLLYGTTVRYLHMREKFIHFLYKCKYDEYIHIWYYVE